MEYGTRWRRLTALLLAFIAAASTAASDPGAVSTTNAGAYEASIAADGDSLAVAWYDTRGEHAQIFARLLDGPEMQLTSGQRNAYEPSLQLLRDRLVVGWYDKLPGSGELTARLGAWTRSGEPRWTVRLSGLGRMGRNPVVRVSGSLIFCAWLEGATSQPYVWVAWFDLDGHEVVPRRRIALASRDTWNLNAAIDEEGQAWVVFDAHIGTHRSELYLLRADAADAAVQRISDDDGFASVYPDIEIEGSRVALTWFDSRDGNSEVYLLVADAATFTGSAVDRRAYRVTQTPGNSIGAYLAWNRETVGLAWCDDTNGQYEVYFQAFDDHGAPKSDAQPLSHTREWSLIPAIVPWQSSFALAWNEYQPAPGKTKAPTRSSVVTVLAPE